MMTTFNTLQQLKRRFFAMRNGAVADSLRKNGAPYRIIFGLNLPQLVEIARDFAPDRQLAMELRKNVSARESLLIAPMIFPREELTPTIAMEWLLEAPTTEVIDVLCLKLIKHLPDAIDVVERLAQEPSSLARYASLRLGANLLPDSMDTIETIARRELDRNDPMTRAAATLILDDIAWRREEE